MRDHYANALYSKKPKKRCVGAPDRQGCTEMILDYGQSDKCLECKDSVRRGNAKRYHMNRVRKRRLHHQAADEQPST